MMIVDMSDITWADGKMVTEASDLMWPVGASPEVLLVDSTLFHRTHAMIDDGDLLYWTYETAGGQTLTVFND
jgi:hypothetical protein